MRWASFILLLLAVQIRGIQIPDPYHSQAEYVHEPEKKPPLPVSEWDFVGPFPSGKTEIEGDPLEAFGGIRNLKRGDPDTKFYSELVDGGIVGWRTLRPGDNGYVDISFPEINWNFHISSLSSVTVLEFQGWVVGDFKVRESGTFLLQCSGLHNIEIDDDKFYFGDIYVEQKHWIPIKLESGIHTIRSRVRARSQMSFTCKWRTVPEEPVLAWSHFLPDVLDGELFSDLIPITVQNTRPHWLRDINVRILGNDKVALVDSSRQFHLAPGQIGQIYFQIQLLKKIETSKPEEENCVSFKASIGIDSYSKRTSVSINLRCRHSRQSFLFTFMDHDGSIAHAAAIKPWKECEDQGCPVVLGLSGVGVKPQNQADSFKYMNPKKKSKADDWLFGLKDAWILAPERDGAHNWEGTGHFTAVTSLSKLAELVQNTPLKVDLSRVIYSGHSRGGHGALVMGTHAPDFALAVNPASGWVKREYYGDANVLFEHDVNMAYLDPELKSIMEKCIVERDVSFMASNLKGIPVLIRLGSADNSVPPWHMRRYARVLQESGVDLTLSEIPGKGHWWWDTKVANDGGVVFDPEIRKFFGSHLTSIPDLPQRFEISLFNPATFQGRGGIQVLQLKKPFLKSSIVVSRSADNSHWTIQTKNIKRWQFYKPISKFGPPATIQVDGFNFSWSQISHEIKAQLNWEESQKVWKIEKDEHFQKTQRGPQNYGPSRQVFARPFLIVLGTSGDEEWKQKIQQTGIYIANSHFQASDTRSPVILDTDLSEDLANSHNLILIGGPLSNSWSLKLNQTLPVHFSALSSSLHTFKIGDYHFNQPNTGLVFVAPHWDSKTQQARLALVVTGTDVKGMEAIAKFSFSSNQALTRAAFTNMVPDFMVSGADFKLKGVGGLLAAGFWGNSWEFRKDLSYMID